MIKVRRGGDPDLQAKLEAALIRYADGGDPADHAEAIRLYELSTNYRGGCGVCIAGRALFIKGLADIAAGRGGDGLSKLRGAMRSVAVKFDVLRGKL